MSHLRLPDMISQTLSKEKQPLPIYCTDGYGSAGEIQEAFGGSGAHEHCPRG